METFIIQQMINLISQITLIVVPFSIVICLCNILVSFFGDFVLGRKVNL